MLVATCRLSGLSYFLGGGADWRVVFCEAVVFSRHQQIPQMMAVGNPSCSTNFDGMADLLLSRWWTCCTDLSAWLATWFVTLHDLTEHGPKNG